MSPSDPAPSVLPAPFGRLQRAERWLGPAAVAACAVAMTVWSWRTWPDPLIDFGQQLYVAWRVAEGDVLYRDLAYHYGPLSPWFSALCFRLFGTSLMTLVFCNLVILACVFVLLDRILSAIGSRLCATIGGITFATVFAFGQLVYYGNYNWVCPYVYNVTHGVALGLAAIYGLGRFHRDRATWALAATGLLTGLMLLTKAEVSMAGGPAIGFGLLASLLGWRTSRAARARAVAVFVGCVAAPVALAVLALARHMPIRQALRGVAETWPVILGGKVDHFLLYRWSLGMLDVEESLAAVRDNLLLYAVLLGVPVALSLSRRGLGRPRWVAIGVFLAVAAVLARPSLFWSEPLIGLPVVLVVLGIAAAVDVMRQREDESPARVLRFSMIVFATLLLAKMVLFTRTYHYGFALAMPATLVALVALFDWLPARVERAGGHARPVRAAALAIWIAFVAVHLVGTHSYFVVKTVVVGRGSDAFRADERGEFVNRMLEQIEREVEPEQSLTVLPMGLTLNYLSRRASSIPYVYFMPSDLVMYGEEQVLQRFLDTPPDFVALVHHDASEFGARFFGQDYARPLYEAIRGGYRVIARVGHVPLQDERFGIELLERIEGAGAEPLTVRAAAP